MVGEATRVLMTTDTVGGVWNYSLAVSRELTSRGCRVLLAALGPAPSEVQSREARAIAGLEFVWRNLRLCWMRDPWDDVLVGRCWLEDLEAAFAPDVIHVNTLGHAAAAWRAPVVTVGHSCVFSWFDAVRGQPPGPDWQRYREEVTRGLQRSDVVAAPTHAMLGELRRFYGPFRREQAIHNGLEMQRVTTRTKEPIILAAGRVWDEAKNVSSLAEVGRDVSWPIVVAGDSRHPDGGTFRVRGIETLGRLAPAELREWYERAAIFAHPARYEPFGLTPLEAASAGCALVLGDIPTLREIWGDAAVFVDPEDPHAIRAALAELAVDDERRVLMGQRARRRATELPISRTADRYVELYGGLMTSAAAPRLSYGGTSP